MMLWKVFLCSLALLLAAVSPVGAAGDWTVLVYLDGDNNLEEDAIDDFLQMAAVGSNARVNVLVQLDRIDSYDTRYGDWTSCKRFRVTRGLTPAPENALEDIGEANMGDPRTLQEFIQWGVRAYPAQHYALILWDHGGGWRLSRCEASMLPSWARRSCCWDVTNGNDYLENREVTQALEQADTVPDLLGYDACLMGMVEVAHELVGLGVDVMVASEETEPAQGWPFDAILSRLVADPAMTPAALGRLVVDEYHDFFDGKTMAAVDVAKVAALTASVDALGQALERNMDGSGPSPVVRIAASAVMAALDEAVLHSRSGLDYPGAYGLSIYFPDQQVDEDYTSGIIRFAEDSDWPVFLKRFVASPESCWIRGARSMAQHFKVTDFIDLYDFAQKASRYACTHYAVSRPDFSFEDISATGKDSMLLSMDCRMIDLPFTFEFYGQKYDWVNICTKGGVAFTTEGLSYLNRPIPSADDKDSNTYIAVLSDDIHVGGDSKLFYQVKGTQPERRFIAQWNEVTYYASDAGTATFQVVLHEKDGRIDLNYKDTDFGEPGHDHGATATVGIQNNSACGLQYSFEQALIPDAFSLSLVPRQGGARSALHLLLGQ